MEQLAADANEESMTAPAPSIKQLRGAVLTLDGYSVRIAVERGHLVADYGIGRDRRSIRLPRVSRDVRRIVVLSPTGSITLEAVRWLTDVGIAYIQLDGAGNVIATNTARSLDDVRLRRQQALASILPAGVAIARELIAAKIAGQTAVCREFGLRAAAEPLARASEALQEAIILADVRFIESRAAASYWDAWSGIPMRFPPKDTRKVPAHWLQFETRRSGLVAAPRRATAPINAMLNYLYGVVEAEASIAAQRVGCDPAMGILHADKQGRDSFACDIMEPVRPFIDAYVLRLLEDRTFLASDFFENREGVCRLLPPMTTALSSTALRWARQLAPIAENVAGQLGQIALQGATPSDPNARSRFRTPLTHSNRTRRTSSIDTGEQSLPNRCRDCGRSLRLKTRTLCDQCLPRHAAKASAKAKEVQGHLRAIGEDRRSAPDVRETHRIHASRTNALNLAWEKQQTSIPSLAVYAREILPYLEGVTVREIAKATGLSIASCKLIRKASMTPHPRHWEVLKALTREKWVRTAGK